MKKMLLVQLIGLFFVTLHPLAGIAQMRCDQTLVTELAPRTADETINEILRTYADSRTLSAREAAESLYQEMINLEKHLQRREYLNGNATRVSIHQIRSRLRRMILAIRTQEPHVILNQYRDLFRDAEMSFFKIIQAESKLQELRQHAHSRQNEIDAAQAELVTQSEIFGRNYTEYTQVRRILEAIRDKNVEVIQNYGIGVVGRSADRTTEQVAAAPDRTEAEGTPAERSSRQRVDRQPIENGENAMNPSNFDSLNAIDLNNPSVISSAVYVLSRLGLNEVRTSFPEMFPSRVDAATEAQLMSLSNIQKYYREHPRVIISKLRHDLRNEGKLLYKVVSYSFFVALNAARNWINRMPPRWAQMVSWITGLVRDQYLLDVYLDKVERVLTLNGTVRNKLDLLRDLSSNSSRDEMLITFARIAIFSDGWVHLKEAARTLSETSDIYKAFYERMEKAEENVRSQGHLSLYGQRSFAVEGPAFMVTAGFLVYEGWPQIMQFQQYLASLLGLGG